MSPLSIADLPRFKSAFAAHRKRAWCYYVPFLLSYSLPPDRPLIWDLCEGSLCLFVRRRGKEGERVDLMFPPLPCSEEALAACLDTAQRQNPDPCLRILWADAEDAERLRAAGFEVTFKEEEYLYDPSAIAGAEGPPFRDLRKRIRRFEREHPYTFRRMVPSDRDGCEALLRDWRRLQGRKRSFLLDWGYTKAALRLVGELSEADLSGWGVEIGGELRAFALAGEMGEGQANFFVAKSDPSVRSLSEFLRWRVCGELRRFSRINDASDLGLPGLRQHKMKFRPVEMLPVYTAQKK
ncbi:MAG: GNAT family N-acetyltransferase [Candidatus Latescibacteria bacterium]|nr:GNAT family N-acetyltransferase [Candidatus Latescibacterota bacterium]